MRLSTYLLYGRLSAIMAFLPKVQQSHNRLSLVVVVVELGNGD
ncbi:MAG: hypothetical protein V7K48_21350 [Nostoc sp.]